MSTKERTFQLSLDEVLELQEQFGGLCLACGEMNYGNCEPDAEGYECEACGEMEVMGVDQAVMIGLVTLRN